MARRYVFRLQAVLKLRRRREDECRRRVAEQLRKIADLGREIRLIEAELTDEMDLMRRGQLQPTLDVTFARRQRGYVGLLERRRVEAGQLRTRLEAELHERQSALVHASREVKALEKLRDRQVARAADQERRALRSEEDEIAAVCSALETRNSKLETEP